MAASSTTFPLAQQGLFSFTTAPSSGFSGAAILECRYIDQGRIVDVTGSKLISGTWTQQKSKQWVHGIPIREFVAQGVIENGSADYALSQQSTITIGTFTVQLAEWTLRKTWPLVDVTGSGSSDDAEWTWGIPVYSFQARGWATGSGPVLVGTESVTVSFAADDIGTISWASSPSKLLKVDQKQLSAPLYVGGAIPTAIAGKMHGDITYSAGSTDFSWLFINPASDPDDPLKEDAELDTDGEVLSHSVLLYDHTFKWSAATGGPTQYTLGMRWDKA